jgi:hypothetical protein
MPPPSPIDAREMSPPARDLGGSCNAHVDIVSDTPSSSVAVVNAAAVSDVFVDNINIEKHGSSSLKGIAT